MQFSHSNLSFNICLRSTSSLLEEHIEAMSLKYYQAWSKPLKGEMDSRVSHPRRQTPSVKFFYNSGSIKNPFVNKLTPSPKNQAKPYETLSEQL